MDAQRWTEVRQQRIIEQAARLAMMAAQQLAVAWETGEAPHSIDWEQIETAVELAQEATQLHRADGGASLLEADDRPARWADPLP